MCHKTTAPGLKAGHPVSYSSIVCSFGWGFLGFLLLLSFYLLACYTHYVSMCFV